VLKTSKKRFGRLRPVGREGRVGFVKKICYQKGGRQHQGRKETLGGVCDLAGGVQSAEEGKLVTINFTIISTRLQAQGREEDEEGKKV